MKRYAHDDYTFIINRVKLEDRGEYIIRAENHHGYREEVVFLNVQRKYILSSLIFCFVIFVGSLAVVTTMQTKVYTSFDP